MRASRVHTAAFSLFIGLALGAGATPSAFSQATSSIDHSLRRRLAESGVRSPHPGPEPSAATVHLGRALFHDKLLSGNRDISCATCHHPTLVTGDALSLPIGTRGIGLGTDRDRDPTREFIPRNATELFNRGDEGWTTMFWDMRVERLASGGFRSPAGALLPGGFRSALEVQAMFPVTSRDEMRGQPADIPQGNELASFDDADFTGIWAALMDRLWAIPEYRDLFRAAFPGIGDASFGFQHAAVAIAAYEQDAFTFRDSPFDRYLAGEDGAMNLSQKRGALLFYGKANCVSCHSGGLMTDQRPHCLGVPQLGPGKAPEAPLDLGRMRVTGDSNQRFGFRTPPLRNVAATGPWMHDGAFTTLEGAVLHHLQPVQSLLRYDRSQLATELQDTVVDEPRVMLAMLRGIDPVIARSNRLRTSEFHDLIAFLHALTSPSLVDLPSKVPVSVPSGLPVD
ncbi:MAG: cytochrome c peroxidase [Isosphaeraceae bacterium]